MKVWYFNDDRDRAYRTSTLLDFLPTSKSLKRGSLCPRCLTKFVRENYNFGVSNLIDRRLPTRDDCIEKSTRENKEFFPLPRGIEYFEIASRVIISSLSTWLRGIIGQGGERVVVRARVMLN